MIELIVVIAIIAIATAGVAFAIRDTGQARLDREAERLAALLESARAQSRASGVPVRWSPVPGGFKFDGLPAGALPRRWLAEATEARAEATTGTALPFVLLGPDPILPAQQVRLTSSEPGTRALRVASDGLRPFAVADGP